VPSTETGHATHRLNARERAGRSREAALRGNTEVFRNLNSCEIFPEI
jgi:hypothetical protein